MPSEMRGAQQAALMALEWRRDGLDRIAQQIRNALGDESEQADEAINDIAGQMAAFMASDVAWDTRVIPFITNALEEQEIGGQEISRSPFLASTEWVQPQKVAEVLDQQLTSGDGGGEPTGPGLHGSGLDSTLYGDDAAAARRHQPAHLRARDRRSSSTSPTRARTTSSTSR